jgi:hypothetical protein
MAFGNMAEPMLQLRFSGFSSFGSLILCGSSTSLRSALRMASSASCFASLF